MKHDKRKEFDPLDWEFLEGNGNRATDWTASFAFGLFVIFVGHWLYDVGSAAWAEATFAGLPDVGQWWADVGRSIGDWLGGAQ